MKLSKKKLLVLTLSCVTVVGAGLASLTGCSPQDLTGTKAASAAPVNNVTKHRNSYDSTNNMNSMPQVVVPVDMKIVENEQKGVDAGHSPWQLDPAFVAQVFVSLKISPAGIKGKYPIKYEELKLIKNTGKEAIIEVSARNTPISRVYLKQLIKQDSTGIWTVVGYDPMGKNSF